MEDKLFKEEGFEALSKFVIAETASKTTFFISQQTGLSNTTIDKMKVGILPRPNVLKKFIDTFFLNEQLQRVTETNAETSYIYWNIIYPQKEINNKITGIFAKLMERKGIYRKELKTNLGMSTAAFSAYMNGSSVIPYEILKNFCRELGITVREALLMLYNSESRKYRESFFSMIEKKMKKLGVTKQELCGLTGMSTVMLAKIESGELTMRFSILKACITALDLNPEEAYEAAREGFVINLSMEANRNLELALYNEIRMKNDSRMLIDYFKKLEKTYTHVEYRGKTVEMHTFLTLFLLTYLDSRYFICAGESNYYIHNIEKKGNLSLDLLGDEYKDEPTYAGIINKAMRRRHISASFLRTLTEVKADSFKSQLENNDSLKDLSVVYRMHLILGLPVTLGIEAYLANFRSPDDAEIITYKQINHDIVKAPKWNLFDCLLDTEMVTAVFDFYIKAGEVPYSELADRIKKLDIPTPTIRGYTLPRTRQRNTVSTKHEKKEQKSGK